MSDPTGKCEICGEPMPAGEEMFKYHGFSGDCPKPPLPRPVKPTYEQLQATIEQQAAKIAELEAIIKASQEPRPISTAPQDDPHFIGYTRKYGWHETCWSDVQAKQISFSKGENTWPFIYWIPCPNPVIKEQP